MVVLILTHDYLSQSLRHSLYESVTSYRQRVINENRQIFGMKNKFDLFLSHSFLDRDEVTNLVARFNKCGYSVYVDWMYDPQLDRSNVTKKTAEKLRQTMEQSQGLAYLATGNSSNSKWCPWELGYFDGKSRNSRCCILPVLSYNSYSYRGQEYLGLYPYLQYEKYANEDLYDFWVHDQESDKYILLRAWLKGLDPIDH